MSTFASRFNLVHIYNCFSPDYNYLYDYYPWAEQLRKKRSAHLARPQTAENMGGGEAAVKSSRVKRDLTQDEIRQLLQSAVEEDVEQLLRTGEEGGG